MKTMWLPAASEMPGGGFVLGNLMRQRCCARIMTAPVIRMVFLTIKKQNAIGSVPELIEGKIYEELISLYPELGTKSSLSDCLIRCVEKTGRQFVFVIDEWDAPIRVFRV